MNEPIMSPEARAELLRAALITPLSPNAQKIVDDMVDYLHHHAELSKLERAIAEAAARDLIGDQCDEVEDDDPVGDDVFWQNTKSHPWGLAEEVERAARYMEMRGLLKRHPKNTHWVRLQREPNEPQTDTPV